MQIDLLKDIVSSIAGEKAKSIVELLSKKKNVNEFLIAKKIDLTINQTRNILYTLADEGLVSFIRKKDNRKGGWYTYYWTLDAEKSLVKFKDVLRRHLDKLNTKLNSKKTERFYFCENCNIEYNEETSLLQEYACAECGETLILKDPEKEINELNKEIEKITKVLNEVEEEINLIQVKQEKSKQRKEKLDLKRKEKEKEEKKKKRQAKTKKEKKEKSRKKPKKVKKKKIKKIPKSKKKKTKKKKGSSKV